MKYKVHIRICFLLLLPLVAMANEWNSESQRACTIGRVATFEDEVNDDGDYQPTSNVNQYKGYTLVWQDEFDKDGRPDERWNYECGFVRNRELQWYQPDNARVRDGVLVIEGRREVVENPHYEEGSNDWQRARREAEYTSSSLTTRRSFHFKYGRVEVRAKIPTASGAWPAIWLLGNRWGWPSCGEIDMMEYYVAKGVPSILANACWADERRFTPVWDSAVTPLTHFTGKDAEWTAKYHVWRMDWDEDFICLYLDGELLNTIDLNQTTNRGGDGKGMNPFSNDVKDFGMYILLNLAIGENGGVPDDSRFPLQYLIDYVRVYTRNQVSSQSNR